MNKLKETVALALEALKKSTPANIDDGEDDYRERAWERRIAAIKALKELQEQPEPQAQRKPLRKALDNDSMASLPEPVNKTGSPCPEFWDWLPKAYRDGHVGDERKFTKYNMEVAFLAGKHSVSKPSDHTEQPLEMASLPEPVAWMYINAYGEAEDIGLKKSQFGETPTVPLYTAPPKREWQGLTNKEIWSDGSRMGLSEDGIRRFAREIEAKLKEKNA